MALLLGDLAPDFTADSADGPIRFHAWLGDFWGVLFSHPTDFAPVCTTELAALARMAGEFERRRTKLIGLSVDSVADHRRWSQDIADVGGVAPGFPMIGDPDDDARGRYPQGRRAPKPYLRYVPAPVLEDRPSPSSL